MAAERYYLLFLLPLQGLSSLSSALGNTQRVFLPAVDYSDGCNYINATFVDVSLLYVLLSLSVKFFQTRNLPMFYSVLCTDKRNMSYRRVSRNDVSRLAKMNFHELCTDLHVLFCSRRPKLNLEIYFTEFFHTVETRIKDPIFIGTLRLRFNI